MCIYFVRKMKKMEKYESIIRNQLASSINSSITDVATKSGVHMGTISSFLKGNRGLSISNIAKLVKAGYPISVDEAIKEHNND